MARKANAADKSEANKRLLDEMAERVHQVMLASFGAMKAWSKAEVRSQLALALEALEKYPEIECTHGLVSLERTGVPYVFNVRLNLGTLTYFPETKD